MKNNRQAVLGVILGQAIGDALGHPTEFNKSRFITELPDANTFTDDTQMMMAIAEAILTTKPLSTSEQDVQPFMTEVGRNFVRWAAGDPRWGNNDRSPGGTCMGGVYKLRSMGFSNWAATGSGNGGKGNGGVMRVSCVGAAFWRDPMLAFQLGGLTSVPTHNNMESIIASAVCAATIAFCIQGVPFSIALAKSLGFASAPKRQNFLYAPQGNTDEYPEFAIGHLGAAYAFGAGRFNHAEFNNWNGNDFKGVEALAAAIYWNTKSCNYRDTVVGLANHTGDSDTTAAIGGAIAGSRWGYGMIPGGWRQNIEKTQYLHELAERLWDFSETVGDTRRVLARTV